MTSSSTPRATVCCRSSGDTTFCGDGTAEDRGEVRTKIELTLPPEGWLGKLLSPTLGKIITVGDVASLFPLQ